MRTDEFVMRGKTASSGTEILNFSGRKPGYAYKLIDFELYQSQDIGTSSCELAASISAGKASINPLNPDFNDEALIGVCQQTHTSNHAYPSGTNMVINDTFLITQNLILEVRDAGPDTQAVNWQCRFKPVKLKGPEEAVANYKQFMISDG